MSGFNKKMLKNLSAYVFPIKIFNTSAVRLPAHFVYRLNRGNARFEIIPLQTISLMNGCLNFFMIKTKNFNSLVDFSILMM